MDNIYLDGAAASRYGNEILAFYLKAMTEDYANQEGIHSPAYQARQHLKEAEKQLLDATVSAPENHRVIWASSATECFRILAGFIGRAKVISSTLEHPALTANFRRDCVLHTLSCDTAGQIILPGAVTEQPQAVIFHHVQSEIGVIQDQARLFAAFPDALKISDSVQSAGKIDLEPSADIHIISGIKFGSPGGAAMLCRKNAPGIDQLEKFVKKMRSEEYQLSRISVPLCRTMAFAAGTAVRNMKKNFEHISRLDRILTGKLANLNIFPLLVQNVPKSPYISNFFLPGMQAAVIVRMLSAQGIHCASGSACAAESGAPSPALLALGKSKKDAYSGLRISFDRQSSENDVNFLAFELEKALKNY